MERERKLGALCFQHKKSLFHVLVTKFRVTVS